MAIFADTLSDIGRLREIAGVLTRHGFGQFIERINLGRLTPGRAETPVDQSDEASAQRLVRAFQELGPTFIKLGQILSSRPDVLPAAYIKALQTLQDRVVPFGFEEVRKRIEEEFGKNVEDLYAELEEKPIASASVGQVHRGIARDGTKVAVKIKRPGIDEIIRGDVSLLYRVARLIESVIDLNVGYTPTEIVGDFDRSMRMELDFGHEADNANQFTSNFSGKSYIRFPEPIAALSGHSVLTMRFIEGVKISEAYSWPEEKRKVVADRLLDAAVQMVFQDGFFHGDPHPGNVFINEDCEVTFLDVGLAHSIPKYLMDSLLQLVVAAGMKDSSSLARVVYKLGASDQRVNLTELKHDLEIILDRYFAKSWGSISASELLTELMDKGAKHGIKHPTALSGLAKAILNFEGVIRALYPELDLLEFAKPYTAKFFSQKMTFESLKPEFIKRANEIFTLLQDMPLQVSQLMMDMDKGRINVTVSSEDIRSLQAALRSLAITLFFGILSAAFVVAGFTALSSIPPGATMGSPGVIAAISAFVLSAGTGFLALAWHLVAIRLRRPKLTDWIKKP